MAGRHPQLFQQGRRGVIQHDAIEKKGLKQLLFEPETLGQVTPNIELVGTLMSLKNMIPEQTKETAREVVRAVVEEIMKRLRGGVEQAVRGALDRSRHSPIRSLPNMDWARTIRRNLKNYDRERKVIIPDSFHFFARQHRRREWNVIVCMDQSGSMADSVVYGGVTGAIFASLPSLETHVVVFDTEVVDLTEKCHDPVDLLFGVQLGGGTDINRAVGYCQGLVHDPRKTLFLLITDLFEGGNGRELVRRMEELVAAGVRAICLLALSDSGVPSHDQNMAGRFADVGVPCFGCTPAMLPMLLEGALKGQDLQSPGRALRGQGRLRNSFTRGLTPLGSPVAIYVTRGLTPLGSPVAIDVTRGLTPLGSPVTIDVTRGLTPLGSPVTIDVTRGLTPLGSPG